MTPLAILTPEQLEDLVERAVARALDRGPARPPDELLTTEQAATEAGVAPKTIRRRIRTGELRAERVGSRWRIRRSALSGTGRTSAGILSTLPSGR